MNHSHLHLQHVRASAVSVAFPETQDTRGLGWRMYCGVEVTESSTNKQHHLSQWGLLTTDNVWCAPLWARPIDVEGAEVRLRMSAGEEELSALRLL